MSNLLTFTVVSWNSFMLRFRIVVPTMFTVSPIFVMSKRLYSSPEHILQISSLLQNIGERSLIYLPIYFFVLASSRRILFLPSTRYLKRYLLALPSVSLIVRVFLVLQSLPSFPRTILWKAEASCFAISFIFA